MRIRSRIILSFTTLGVGVSVASLVAMGTLRTRLIHAAETHASTLREIQAIDADLRGAVEGSVAYLVSGENQEKEEFQRWANGFDEHFKRFTAMAHEAAPGDAREAVLLERITQEKRRLVEQASASFSEFTGTGSVSKPTFAIYKASIDSLLSDVEEFVEIESAGVDEAQNLVLATSRNIMFAIGLGTLFSTVVIGLIIARSITRPLSRLNSAAIEVGAGNLDCRANLESGDEIGELASAFDSMAQALQGRDQSLKTLNAVLRENEERFALAMEATSEGLWDWNIATGYVFFSKRWCTGLGFEPDEVEPHVDFWKSLVHADDMPGVTEALEAHLRGETETYECRNRLRMKSGEYRWNLDRGRVVARDDNGNPLRMVGVDSDITRAIEAEEELLQNNSMMIDALEREKQATADLEQAMSQLEVTATTDRLTGLPNREVFLDRLGQALKRAKRHETRFAVLFFDFDRFKVVNDSLGHNIGDALLCAIADRFRTELRDSDTVARLGGDEFVVLLNDLTHWSDARTKSDALLDVFAEPHTLEGHRVVSTASIGLVTSQTTYDTPEQMIRDADIAMYQAKDAGKGTAVEFDQSMHERALDRLTIEDDLRTAVEGEELRLVYQPIIDLDRGDVLGFEALIRWEHPERGTVSPLDFIPIAEDTGLIIDIGRWVLRAAAEQIADWNNRLGLDRRLSMNVNVAKRQLLESSLRDDVIECRDTLGLQADDLRLEITESAIADGRSDVVPVLTELRQAGVRIAMDDFGTGLSSLGSLHDYPIDMLKIDRSFVMAIDGDRSLLAVVAAITTLADNLGITTVAEGIETAEAVAALQSIDCDRGQGFYFARPMPPDEAEAYVLARQRERTEAA